LRQHSVSWVQRIYPGEKYAFQRIQRGPAPLKPASAIGGISLFGGLAAIFAGLEFAGLLYITRFAGKSPGYASLKSGRPISVHRRGMWPASGGIYLQNMPLIPSPLRKMMFEQNR
jgi:hypothetical protein